MRQALQLVQNELPGAEFEPLTSTRAFSLSLCSPLDLRLGAAIINHVKQIAPQLNLQIKSYINNNIEHQLRYQDVEFVIGYSRFESAEFRSPAMFDDELVLAVAQVHPRIGEEVTPNHMLAEQHAVVSRVLDRSVNLLFRGADAARRDATVHGSLQRVEYGVANGNGGDCARLVGATADGSVENKGGSFMW